ncbi:SGNH/GDSL hydrolase family protein [Salinibacter ruber]|uniref:SGNH/GDSL hydrolase family protein n=1 Tax=Salinibacter ruber TaxID=146919 RepID=UPI000E577254|nr:SGNH/GDSL hydrolase family protein [Salinibacter ruber]
MLSFSHLPTVRTVALLLLAGSLVVACDDDTLTPQRQSNQDALFDRYVSIGNSITAGFQSGGISPQTQTDSYAVLLSQQMETEFSVPLLRSPGCPSPLIQFFDANSFPDPQRPPNAPPCAQREPTPPLVTNNVAVPNATVLDVITNDMAQGASPNALTQFLLGDRTQIEAAREANPTFATVWIGNNNVLGPAVNGTADVTAPNEFESRYTSMLDSLTSFGDLQGGVLVGVANVAFTPFFSPGPVYFGLDQQGQFPQNFNVASNCDTQDPNTDLTPLVPLEYGFSLIGQAIQNPGQTVTLDCQAANTPVLTLTEVSTIAGTVQQYNAFIQQQAQQRDLAYFNPNTVLAPLYTNEDGDQDPTNDLIPKFPDRDSDQPFGQFFSLDGIHPSSATHRVITNRLITTINNKYNTSLQTIDAPDVPGS